MKTVTCILPGGYADEAGVLHAEAEFRRLSGNEEELLAGSVGRAMPVLVTEVLAGCLIRIGTIRPVLPSVIRRLLVADRQYLLLKLREATFGPEVRGTLRCPWPGCGARVDTDFMISDIPVRPSRDKGPVYRMELSGAAAPADGDGAPVRSVSFRLPNGSDQEAIMPLYHENPARALAMLLELCIVSLGGCDNPGTDLLAQLSPAARREIEAGMEQVSPAVDLDMQAECTECGRSFTVPFDIQDFFFGELRADADMLYREIHYLAYHYHWSEQEIMAMTQDRRRRYIEVLSDEIEKMNHAH